MNYILSVDPVKHEEQRKRFENIANGAAIVGGDLNLNDLMNAMYEIKKLRESQPEVDQEVFFRTEEDRARFIAWANLSVKEVPNQSLILEGTPLPSTHPDTAPSS